MDRIFAKLLYEMEKHLDTVLVTILSHRGSAPRGAGAQMLVGSKGRILGTVGGGAMEAKAEETAMELLTTKTSLRRHFPLYPHVSEDIGMICGGEVEVLFQFISGNSKEWETMAGMLVSRMNQRQSGWLVLRTDGSLPSLLSGDGQVLFGREIAGATGDKGWRPQASEDCFPMSLPIGERAVIFGCGHCAQALAPLLQTVGFRVTAFDDRPEYANKECFPTAERVILGDYGRISDFLTLTEEDYVVVMTSGHGYDLDVQDQILRGKFAYVGVIGSKRKIAAVNGRLLERGVPEAAIAAVHTPIGMPIKAVTPEEIAVSIAGEMIHVRANRREADGIVSHGCPIHETHN